MIREFTFQEVENKIKRIQVLYSMVSPKSKRKIRDTCQKNPMRSLITIQELHKYIDPRFPSVNNVLFDLPDGRRECFHVNHTLPKVLRNCQLALRSELNNN